MSKIIKEVLDEATSTDDRRLVNENNKSSVSKRNSGRVGKPFITASGDEFAGSLYLGDGAYIVPVKGRPNLFMLVSFTGNRTDVAFINKSQIVLLKKLK